MAIALQAYIQAYKWAIQTNDIDWQHLTMKNSFYTQNKETPKPEDKLDKVCFRNVSHYSLSSLAEEEQILTTSTSHSTFSRFDFPKIKIHRNKQTNIHDNVSHRLENPFDTRSKPKTFLAIISTKSSLLLPV